MRIEENHGKKTKECQHYMDREKIKVCKNVIAVHASSRCDPEEFPRRASISCN